MIKNTPTASLLLLSGLLAGLGGCAESGPPSSSGSTLFVAPHPGIGQIELWRFELAKQDRAWAYAIHYEDFEAWASYFAPGGSRISAGVGEIRGPDAILAWLREATASQGITGFTWAPNRAEVSNSGDLGYTVGEYRASGMGADGVHTGVAGEYVSIWRRQEDGSWKVEMTLGNPTGPPEPIPFPGGTSRGR